MFLYALLLLSASSATAPVSFTRDDYGVPHVSAATPEESWRAVGYAVAQDRLWQMEMSRHTVRGAASEILGVAGLASDQEVLKTAYTDEEIEAQFARMPKPLQSAFEAYAEGVNDFIAAGNLPPEYAQNDLKPEKWRPRDSAAIAIWLLQYFGRGGAGGLRNLLALGYLKSQKPIQSHLLDVIDDFLWQNDPSSPTTVDKEDESGPRPSFPAVPRAVTEKHLAMLPSLSLLELLPGLSAASREKSTLLAERSGVPFKTGSYCMVVGSQRSATGMPLLLNGPQMGFTVPSIVHEISIDSPTLHVEGMDVPGIPGILVGQNQRLAWGITSGVAATDDIVFAPKVDSDHYRYGGQTRNFEKHDFTVHVKGSSDRTVSQLRTADSVVVLNTQPHGASPGYVFGKRSSYRGRELESLSSIAGLWTAATVAQADASAQKATMSFNVFLADDGGHVGYRYGGAVPIRTPDLDPRFPVPDDPKYAWKSMIPPEQMPHVVDPRQGLITNWNNKPVSWWPNLDTPVWGRIFHVSTIRGSLTKPKLSAQDLELAAWNIARTDETWPYFKPYYELAIQSLLRHAHAHPEQNDNAEGLALQEAGGFDGLLLQGSRQANVYRIFLRELRKALFASSVGTFMSEANFSLIAQPSVMLMALEGKTRFNYLHRRSAESVAASALLTAVREELGSHDGARYVPSVIRIPDEPPVPYANRGTYIQVIELLAGGPSGRNVLPPGIAATGPHSRDQVSLSRAWIYKPMFHDWKM